MNILMYLGFQDIKDNVNALTPNVFISFSLIKITYHYDINTIENFVLKMFYEP
jgi:hypothetical protein